MITIHQTKSGLPTVEVDSARIHSAYNPEKEAERFLNNQPEVLRTRGCLVILGEGLGYITLKARALFPQRRILTVFYCEELYKKALDIHPHIIKQQCWHPGLKTDLYHFLQSRLHDTDILGLAVTQWLPSSRAFPEESHQAGTIVKQVIQILNGNIMSTGKMSHLRVKNAFRNYLEINTLHMLRPTSKPVIILASGPTLEKSIPFLSKKAAGFITVALPSSITILNENNITADIYINTDPGYYASRNIQEVPEKALLASPLTGACSSRNDSLRRLILNQASFTEKAFSLDNTTSIPLNMSSGTVSVTALYTARMISTGPVVYMGLDMSFHGTNTHAHPHSSYSDLTAAQNRLKPLHFLHAEQGLRYPLKQTGSGFYTNQPLETYAGWFCNNHFSNTFRIHPSPVELGIPELKISELAPLASSDTLELTIFNCAPLQQRKKQARKVLDNWQKEIQNFSERPFANSGVTDRQAAKLLYHFATADYIALKKASLQHGRVTNEVQNCKESALSRLHALRHMV